MINLGFRLAFDIYLATVLKWYSDGIEEDSNFQRVEQETDE